MNIEMIKQGANQAVEAENNIKYGPHSSEASRMKTQGMGYSLDITGTVTENAAYGKEELKSASELMASAQVQDVTMQRNYMAVMSNSMSADDFAELSKDGINPLNTRLDEVVTSLDRLKIKMAESGQTIAGFNDNISDEKLLAATGDVSRMQQIKQALDEANLPKTHENVRDITDAMAIADNLKPMTDEAIKYMILHDSEPTVESVYLAEYSAGVDTRKISAHVTYEGAATYASVSQSADSWHEIADQAERIVEASGIEDIKTGMEDARWLVSHQIPLSGENLNKYESIKEIDTNPGNDKLLEAMTRAISEGKSATKALLNDNFDIFDRAVKIRDDVVKISDDDIKAVVIEGRQINIRNLVLAETKREESVGKASASVYSFEGSIDGELNNDRFISARRQLEEVRLVMTTEANLTLLRKGISVDTRPLEQLVDELKAAEAEFYRPLMVGQESTNEKGSDFSDSAQGKITNAEVLNRVSLFKSVESAVVRIKSAPVEAVRLANDFSLKAIDEKGVALKAAYDKARSGYETLMTAPRADMGDSIKKAFRNIDDILEDLRLEVNEENRKSVRILGYSHMEITSESVEEVNEAVKTLNNVLDALTPARTLKLIREGRNPLDENLKELEEELAKESIEETDEKYSRFLYRLEQSGEIDETEKAAYIGMFRLYRQVSKSDSRVIGNVIANNEELTLSNLLKAARTNRAQGMDMRIDDDFGMLEELITGSESITSQIERGFVKLMRPLEPTVTAQPPDSENSTDETAENPVNTRDSGTDNKYTCEKLDDIRHAALLSGDAETILERLDMPVTVENILASSELMRNRGQAFGKILNNRKEEELSKKAEAFVENFDDDKSAKAAAAEFTREAEARVQEHIDNSEKYSDVKEWILTKKQIVLSGMMVRNESYEVPLETKDGWTSVHVEIIHNKEESPKVDISFETEEYGRVSASFKLSGQSVSGFIVSTTSQGIDSLKAKKEALEKDMQQAGLKVSELNFVKAQADINYTEPAANEGVANSDLYKVAKTFIISLR